jgi:hypothetical protein
MINGAMIIQVFSAVVPATVGFTWSVLVGGMSQAMMKMGKEQSFILLGMGKSQGLSPSILYHKVIIPGTVSSAGSIKSELLQKIMRKSRRQRNKRSSQVEWLARDIKTIGTISAVLLAY